MNTPKVWARTQWDRKPVGTLLSGWRDHLAGLILFPREALERWYAGYRRQTALPGDHFYSFIRQVEAEVIDVKPDGVTLKCASREALYRDPLALEKPAVGNAPMVISDGDDWVIPPWAEETDLRGWWPR
jgi:hypothetical protein